MCLVDMANKTVRRGSDSPYLEGIMYKISARLHLEGTRPVVVDNYRKNERLLVTKEW